MTRGFLVGLVLPMLGAIAGATVASAAPADRQALPLQVAQTTTVVLAPQAPPPPRQEVVPAPPSNATQVAYWQPGHWTWDGANYICTPGQYLQPPQVQAVWIPGQWLEQPGGGWMWIDGHWQ